MKKRIKKKIYIKINKKYKESMSDVVSDKKNKKVQHLSDGSNFENYDWVEGCDELLKTKYLSLPLRKWKNLLIEKIGNNNEYSYQDSVNAILENDIFKGEQFFKEENINNNFLVYKFFEDLNKAILTDIKPDFIVKKVPIKNFMRIINDRKNCFRYDFDYEQFKNKEYINIIGEIKTNLQNKKQQIDRYIDYCKQINEKFIF